jgi:hypothetical protein
MARANVDFTDAYLERDPGYRLHDLTPPVDAAGRELLNQVADLE